MLPTTAERRIVTQSSSLGVISPDTPHFPLSPPTFLYRSPRLPPHQYQKYLNSPLSKT